MTWLIIVGIVITVYLYDQNQKQPYRAYDQNLEWANKNKQNFLNNLKSEISLRNEQMDKIIVEAKIIKPIHEGNPNWENEMDIFIKKIKSNEKTKDNYKYLNGLFHMRDIIVPKFDRNFISMNTRYKTDVNKLVEISDDYREWYFYQARLYDPSNYHILNDSSYEDQEEAKTIILEINRKLDFDMEIDKL